MAAKIIGLTGHAGAGKSTLAEYLCTKYGFSRLAFADALKGMLINAGMCTHDECYREKTERSRWLLQKIGTEVFRKQVHPDWWVQQTAKKLLELNKAGVDVVIDDMRFPNEARLVRSYMGNGCVIKCVRTGHVDATAGSEHDSERLVDTIDDDYTITVDSGEVGKLKALAENYLLTTGFLKGIV